MKRYLWSLLLILPFGISAQHPTFNVSTSTLALGDCPATTTCSSTFTVTNTGAVSANISIDGANTPFSVSPTTFSLAVSGSQTVTVSFNPTYNLTYKNVLILDATNGLVPKSVSVTARGKYTDASNYYVGSEDLWGLTLRNWLWDKIDTNTTSDYTAARNEMFSTRMDGYNGNATNRQIDCVYTGRTITLANTNPRPSATSPDYMNTEHTWPQSMFANTTTYFPSPAGVNIPTADLHHLYPTDADANAERGNDPFGNVTDRAAAWCHDWDIPSQDHACSSGTGSDTWSYWQSSEYEVRGVQKGNTARSMFYMVTRYGNMSSFYTAAQETDLLSWHSADPPDTKEKNRNTTIQNYQSNRNPYVDHPDFISRIGSFVSTYASAPTSTTPVAFPSAESYGNVLINTSLSATILVANRGTETFTINSASTDNSVFTVSAVKTLATTLTSNQVAAITVQFTPTAAQSYNGILTLGTTAGNLSVNLNGIGVLTLPISLVDFSAVQTENKVELQWKIFEGETADYIAVERQDNPQSPFIEIGKVNASGNGAALQSYQFSSPKGVAGLYTYRLKMVEKNGSSRYSNPIKVLVETPNAYALSAPYPNPIRGEGFVQFSVPQTQSVRLILVDTLGRTVQTLYEGVVNGNEVQHYRIDAQTLAAGTYWIQASGASFIGVQAVQVIP